MQELWYNDIFILFDTNHIFEVIPFKEYDLNRKLNSMVRLSIYYSILIFLIKKESNIFCLLFIVLIITVFIYKNDKDNQVDNKSNDEQNHRVCEPFNINTLIVPNKENPLMNPMLYDKDKFKHTSNINDKSVEKSVNKLINDGLVRKNTLFNEFNIYERQFYKMPEHDQGSFAQWCFDNINHCKDGVQSDCTGIGRTGGKGTPN